ncbi:hypothetical protein ACIP9C_09200 [Lysinibacillus sp. NPDC093210]|uniref:hypothetical protein n=1 Tax=Lysinibacillus sp. NPDC093210 TaxID=3364133 RepID=UPI00380478DB
MEDNRYFKHMNWDYSKFEKKCCCGKHDQEHKEKSCCHKHDEWKHKQHHCDCKEDKHCWKEEKHCCKEDKHCWKEEKHCCKEDKHCWKEDRDECKDDHHHCKGCICHLLKRFELGTTVDVYLSGGGSFLGVVFLKLDNRNCCAYFVENGAASEPIIIDCERIDAIRRIATV